MTFAGTAGETRQSPPPTPGEAADGLPNLPFQTHIYHRSPAASRARTSSLLLPLGPRAGESGPVAAECHRQGGQGGGHRGRATAAGECQEHLLLQAGGPEAPTVPGQCGQVLLKLARLAQLTFGDLMMNYWGSSPHLPDGGVAATEPGRLQADSDSSCPSRPETSSPSTKSAPNY